MVNFENELRAALAERATTVPAAITERLRGQNYRPRAAHHRTAVIAAGAACAAAAGGAYAATSAQGPSPAALRQTVHLDGYALTLATGSAARDRSCTPAPGHGRPETVKQARGFFRAYGAAGCLHVTLGRPGAPADAAAVTVGTYHGYLASQPSSDRLTLYLEGSTRNWLVFTATRTGLSARQLIALAAGSIPRCSPQLEHPPQCAAG